ncbi:MAG: substrate-binding domain-containing protein [bacterium]|nr:substrate-binding domain-containing protein [bacterium]
MKSWRMCAFGLVCLVALTGCGPSGTDDGPAQKRIGASLLTKGHVFYQDLADEMAKEAENRGLDLMIQYCEFDGARQIEQLDTFIVKGMDALVVSPSDSAGMTPVIADARAKGIPVFTVDIAAHGADVVSHIASDNVEGGRVIGKRLAALLEGKGTVAIIDNPEVASVQERVRGFEEALAAFPDIEIVAKAPGSGQRGKALTASQDLLQARPDLNAIFGINDDSALGALAAAEEAGLADTIIIVGYDGTPEARDAILRGTALKADTVQYPRAIGRKAVEIIAAHFAGEEVPAVVPVEVGIIDKESLQKDQNS